MQTSEIQLCVAYIRSLAEVATVSWSPDAKLLALGRTDGTIELLETETGKRLHLLKKHRGSIAALSWSPDGTRLASGAADKAVFIWDIESSLSRSDLKKHRFSISSISWSPNGKIVATAAPNGAIRIWNVKSGKLLRVINASYARQVKWTPDGTILIALSKNQINLWHSTTGRHLASLGESRERSSNFGYWSLHLPSQDDWRSLMVDSLPVQSYLYEPDLMHSRTSPRAASESPTDRLNDTYRERYGDIALEQLIEPRPNSSESPVHSLVDEYWFPTDEHDSNANTSIAELTGIPQRRGKRASDRITSTPQAMQLASSMSRRSSMEDRELIVDTSVSPNSQLLASANTDATIKIWEMRSGRLLQTLEGHTEAVIRVAWAPDGRVLFSISKAGEIRAWNPETWEIASVFSGETQFASVAVSVQVPLELSSALASEGASVQNWTINVEQLLRAGSAMDTMHFASAKVVFVGESNVGKSCLALRLTKDEYEEQGTTHGMRVWSVAYNELFKEGGGSPEENKEVVIWDMGGQDEYRLVHQLFFYDTAVALILFDPTRGRVSFDEVEGWDLRLSKQLHGRKAVKLLVGTKLDNELKPDIIDHLRIERLVEDCEFVGYYPVSAKTARGISDLREAIDNTIDWSSLSKVSRPVVFQRIRRELVERREAGEIVLLYSELEKKLHDEDSKQFNSKTISIVLEQLSLQGAIVGTRLASGEKVLVLQISEVERYAGSIIIAARNNPRGVPAIEEQTLTQTDPSLPGISPEERLHPFQERIVIECVVQLLVEHGICLKHEGLLIFPALFQSQENSTQTALSHSVSLFYDFSGAIDNIYSSLVVRLAISERFGRIRLWEDKVEYEKAGQGTCGVRKVERRSGMAHLDLFFSDDLSDDTRDLFTIFVEEHLRREGVSITEVLEVTCACSFQFQESSLRKRIADGYADIICPECEVRNRISEGAQKARSSSASVEQSLLALKTTINLKKERALLGIKKAFTSVPYSSSSTAPIRILHLSDLHITKNDDPISRLQPLVKDLSDSRAGLGLTRLDYLVLSGDLTDRADPEEFEKVHQLVSLLIERFNLSAERCIIVPGNHDLSWDENVYDWKQTRLVEKEKLIEGEYVERGDVYLIRNMDRYSQRFANFSKFHHALTQREYPLRIEDQCVPQLFEENEIQFITINSSWQIDEFFRNRSGISQSSISRGLTKADSQIKQAIQERRLQSESSLLKIAVLHHPVSGNDKIVDEGYLVRLRRQGVLVCLHGHVHEERADLVGYHHPRKMHIVGAGSFGSPATKRPESTPKLYNMLEIARDKRSMRIHTRHMRRDGSMWEGWPVWPTEDPSYFRTFYDIRFD